MDPKLIVVIAAVVIIVLAIAYAVARKRRTELLRDRFGPEYDRAVRKEGPGRAESILQERQKRVEKFPIRELEASERERFVSEWRSVQTRFVDDPKQSVRSADHLVTEVMQARGYPMSDFDQRAADLSVDHPRVVDNYRAAHEIALRHQRGEATTEDLRNAIIYYRSLFGDLLETKPTDDRKREVA